MFDNIKGVGDFIGYTFKGKTEPENSNRESIVYHPNDPIDPNEFSDDL